MMITSSRFISSGIILGILLFLAILGGSNGFAGIGRNAEFRQQAPASSLFRTSHQRSNGTPFPKANLRNDGAIHQLTKRRAIPASISDVLPVLTKSLMSYGGNVPLSQAFALQVFLFAGLRKKLFKMLTRQGFFHALALATGLWSTLGWRGWTTCVMYLFLGVAVTKVKFQEKEKLGIAEGRGGRRGPENVWGSAATGLACAICSAQGPRFLGISSDLYLLGYVASLATKLSDTFASEIGKAYGKTTFLITTFERVPPGTEGAVSAEGTAASVVGGALISLYGLFIGFITPKAVPISIFAAFVATNVESVLGATLQGKKNLEWMTNEVVNFINTLIGAVIAIL
eukprot:CAMPEP_0197186090 /NCGR_PEP_ID=MMETSP1423-20130617/13205_1 /TAXON_ID=476441 /ORGANISM="Pseudo-nitzschia heimii, Strain UNC1101" /LENGTH=342 /DNA_ID=CAMNT_0042637303 /DNA_START=8 /DNA_END=1032 /DNA_ORIENTATION=-